VFAASPRTESADGALKDPDRSRRTSPTVIAVDELQRFLVDRGASLVGVADLSGISPEPRQGLPRGVAVAVALDQEIVSDILTGPTLEYAGECERANGLLDELAEAAARWLRDLGATAAPLPATSGELAADLSTPAPHEIVATLAGLGWIGRTGLLVTKSFGSALRLATVLTDADLPVAAPMDRSLCGVCGLCVSACPARAATGAEWSPGMPREELLDVRKCREACLRARDRLRISHAICGICITVCPWTRRYLEGR
jgi:epoxyqueuosine reductase QueG